MAGKAGGIRSLVRLPAITPLDPHRLRDDWQLAVVLVALVATGVAEPPTAGPGKAAGPGRAARQAAATTGATAGRRHVRPPRSC